MSSQRHSSPTGGGGSAGGGRAGAATLRPRTRRLISIDDEEDLTTTSNATASTSSAATTANSLLRDTVDEAFSTSRRRSPGPGIQSSLSPQRNLRSSSRGYGLELPAASASANRGKSSSLWASSWSSLQGVASTLMGSNYNEPTTPLTPGGSRKRKDKHGRNYSLSVPDEPWGPSGNSDKFLAVGSKEDRLTKVQDEKRKVLLSGVGEERRDVLGRYKRRSSLDRTDAIPSPTHEDDVLVYIHKVVPSDTVAGLSIKYDCTQEIVRKSNRLYPNDTIQLRKVAYIPVESCSLRGRKVAAPGQSNVDLLAGDGDGDASSHSYQNGGIDADYHIATAPAPSTKQSSTSQSIPPDPSSGDAEQQPWKHDSWVELPQSLNPTEIGRLPRRTLGFFPPARRKSVSQNYTDAGTSSPRSITSDEAPPNATPALTPSARTSPGRSASSPGRVPIGRLSRSSSSASKLNPHSRFAANFLRGPGGVGSLHSNVHGPPPDELNRFVAQHMPRLIIEGAEVGGVGGAEGRRMGRDRSVSGRGVSLARHGPRMSFDRISVASGGSAGTGVEAVAGAVEGWMRKVGGKMKESLGTPEMRGHGRDGGGDLIELMDTWDLNGDGQGSSITASPQNGKSKTGGAGESGATDSWESEGHGVLDDGGLGGGGVVGAGGGGISTEAIVNGSKGKGKGKAAVASVSAREEEERLLRERFPPVGRVFEDQGRRM